MANSTRFGSRCEEIAAGDLRMQLVRGSGGTTRYASNTIGVGRTGRREDMHGHGFLFQVKSTTKEGQAVKLDDLDAVLHNALARGLEPGLLLRFCTEDGRPVRNGSWVAVPERVWRELVGVE